MPQQFKDRARAVLQGNINAAATSLAVTAGLADRFPIGTTVNWAATLDWFKAMLVDPSTGAFELIRVGTRTAGSGAFGNILRAQEGTTAQSFNAGALVIHGPQAADFYQALAGIFAYFAVKDSADPKLEVVKTGTGAAAALFHMNGGKLTIAQSDGNGGITTDSRFILDQTNGALTLTDLAFSSDERLKTGWRGLGRNFLQRLADVKHGVYRRKSSGRLEVGVSAQSLREVMPWAVKHSPADGMLTVSYAQAALVAAIQLANDNGDLRAELADLRERVRRLERRA